MPSERQLREALCSVGRELYERGHNAPLDGNLSTRLADRYLLATPTGCHKGRLRAEQIVKVHVRDGSPVDPSQRASSEIRMHVAIYARRPDVAAIVHAHSPMTVALSVAGISLESPVVPEVILSLGGVPTVPYASPTTADVPAAITQYLDRANAFVLERHGPVAMGKDLDEAFARLETIEHTARITVAAMTAGAAKPIPDDEATKLRRMALEAGLYRTPASAREAEDAMIDRLVGRVLERVRGSAG